MIGLEESVLVRTEFFQLRFEKLTLLSRNGFLVEYQNVGDVVVVDLFEPLVLAEQCVEAFTDVPYPSSLSRPEPVLS